MKKSVLFSFLLIAMLSVFAQEKHITFMDSLISPPSSAYYNNFRLAQSPMYNGYFLGSSYDDMSYEMKYYVAKTDFAGTLLWDTIFYFQQPFSSGFGSSDLKMISTSNGFSAFTNSNGVNINNTSQPFLYHVENNGQIDWNMYYSLDSVDAYPADAIQTNDDGYILAGEIYDWSIGGQGGKGISSKYGFIYKTNPSGNIEWSKLYANKDTIEFAFNSVAETSAGYMLAGESVNNKMGEGKTTPGTYDHFMNVLMVDINGDIVWNNALYFDTIVDNGSYFENAQVNVLDNETAIVTFKFYDTLNYYYDLGIASYNIADGNVNWVKGYSLSGDAVDFNLRKVVINGNGNIVVWHDDYGDASRSILYEFDAQGNVLQSISTDDVFNSVFYQDLIATEDGGLMMSVYPDAGSGTKLFKTDKNIVTHCGTENSFSNPDVFDLAYTTYSIVDTVFDVTLNTGTLIVDADSIVNFEQGNYCGCELTIEGTIVEPLLGAAADSVLVTLYKFDPIPGQYNVHDTISTDASGHYYFDYLPEGDYIIKGEPSQLKYPGLVKTYYNNTMSVTQWDSAEVVMVQCGINPIAYNFTLFQGVPQSGTWTCNGYVYEYFGFDPTNKKAPGDPIGDIDITVEQSPGGAISSTTTDEFGYYEFTGLNNNATFIVRVDIPGLPNDSIYTLTINPGDGAIDSLNFYVDSVGVYILPEDIFTSIESSNDQNLSYNLLPNPTRGVVNLVVETNDAVEVSLVVTNVIGETIFNNVYKASSGINKYPIDLTNYNQGIYFVRISQGNDYIIKKVIKQ